jgi:predicted DNA-binding transcriptional regulator YafY
MFSSEWSIRTKGFTDKPSISRSERMPKKASDKSYGAKLIKLFSKLLFTGNSYSLTELSKMLECSKQTVLRLVDDIQSYYGLDLEQETQGNRSIYRIKRPQQAPSVPLTPMEMSLLQMCKTFTQHLLGKELFEEATRGLEKGGSFVAACDLPSEKHFGTVLMGTIDYTPHQQTIKTLITAMEKGRVCRITYHPLWEDVDKTYHVKPYKLFSHKDTIYLHAGLAREPGKRYKKPEFDPMLAVHRLRNVEITDTHYKMPTGYDFGEIFNRDFGVIKDDRFKVQVELTGWAAKYASERVWSPDQKIKTLPDGRISLSFTSASEPEVVSWVLSLGDEAKLIKPRIVLNAIISNCRKLLASVYQRENHTD